MNTTRLKQLYQFLEDRPNDPFILFAIAKEHEGHGDNKNAKQYYLKLQNNHSDYVATYYHLGKLYEQMENFEEALATYERGMEVAKTAGDRHAFGELQGAKEMLVDN